MLLEKNEQMRVEKNELLMQKEKEAIKKKKSSHHFLAKGLGRLFLLTL